MSSLTRYLTTQYLAAVTPHEFDDDEHWLDLARKHKVRLPHHGTPLQTGQMERWLRKLGIAGPQWRAYTGGQTNKQFIEANPTWTLRSWVGHALEYLQGKVDGRFV